MDHVHFFWKWIVDEINNLSGLSNYDFVCLVAHYNDIANGAKSKVDSRLEGRGFTPEQLAHVTKKFSERFTPIVSCRLKFTKPFGHLKFGPMSYVLTLFENYERGCLPFPGVISEQPAQIMEVFSVLSALKRESEIRSTSETTKSHGRNINQNKPRASR